MTSRHNSSKLPPRSVLEVPNVLQGDSGRSILSSISRLKYTVAKKDDQPGDVAANRDWGVSVVEEDGIPQDLKMDMMRLVLSVNKVKLLATNRRDDGFFHRFFINKMCSSDGASQQRQINMPQHIWHTDATFHPTKSNITVVLTIYNSELDSSALSAHDVGGFIKISDFDDGRFIPASNATLNHPKSGSTITYFPKTNAFYIFPGYFVAHAVFKVKPGTVRYSVVMLVRLGNNKINGETPNIYLRREWATSNLEGRKEVCDRCWSAFHTHKQVLDHQRRSSKCLNLK
jgi:hypothetical protein